MARAAIPTPRTLPPSATAFDRVEPSSQYLTVPKTGPINRALSALKQSARDWRRHLLFSIIWAAVIALCVTVHFLQLGWAADSALWPITAIYGCGALVGGYAAVLFAQSFPHNRTTNVRFALFFVLLILFTLGFTLMIFILQHRLYFSQWHSDFGSITWFFQLFFTSLGSIFLFLLTGLRPLLPWGVVALFIASFAFSRGWMSASR